MIAPEDVRLTSTLSPRAYDADSGQTINKTPAYEDLFFDDVFDYDVLDFDGGRAVPPNLLVDDGGDVVGRIADDNLLVDDGGEVLQEMDDHLVADDPADACADIGARWAVCTSRRQLRLAAAGASSACRRAASP